MVKRFKGSDLESGDALKLTTGDMAHNLRNDLATVLTELSSVEYTKRLAILALKRAIFAEDELKSLRQQLEASEAENRLLREEIEQTAETIIHPNYPDADFIAPITY